MEGAALRVSRPFPPHNTLWPPPPDLELLPHCTEPCAVCSSKVKIHFLQGAFRDCVASLWPQRLFCSPPPTSCLSGHQLLVGTLFLGFRGLLPTCTLNRTCSLLAPRNRIKSTPFSDQESSVVTAAQSVGAHYLSEEPMEVSSLFLHLPALQVPGVHVQCWARPPCPWGGRPGSRGALCCSRGAFFLLPCSCPRASFFPGKHLSQSNDKDSFLLLLSTVIRFFKLLSV